MSRGPKRARWALVLLAAVGCSSAPTATGTPATTEAEVASTTASSTTVVASTTVATPPPAQVPSAPAATPTGPAATTPETTPGPPATVAPSGPRMLLVELSSHPNGGVCALTGTFVVIQLSFQSADTYLVVVKNAAGDVLASLPPNSAFITPHLCAQMPVLYRFYPLAADGTFGPPWNFNV